MQTVESGWWALGKGLTRSDLHFEKTILVACSVENRVGQELTGKSSEEVAVAAQTMDGGR